MGKAKSCAIAAAVELGRRLFSARGVRIGMPKDAFPLLAHYADKRQEHFIVISLNGGHEVNAVREVTKGLINKTVVHPREVFADPITDRACAILVAHNHPSGNLDPSDEDFGHHHAASAIGRFAWHSGARPPYLFRIGLFSVLWSMDLLQGHNMEPDQRCAPCRFKLCQISVLLSQRHRERAGAALWYELPYTRSEATPCPRGPLG